MELEKNTIFVNVNGMIGTPNEVKISVLDRGFLFGDSVYEVSRTHGKVPLFLKEHLDRLWQSALGLNIEIRHERDELWHEIKRTLEQLGSDNAYFRVIVTRGEGDIGLDPRLAKTSNLVIIAKPFRPNPEWWYEKGVELIFTNVERNARKSIDPNIKSGNYLNNVMAYMQAKNLGAYDALMLNAQGHITEGTTNNIWFVTKDNRVCTPDLSVGLLKGITREKVLEVAKDLGFKVEEGLFTPSDIYAAREAFITSSTREVVPVVKIDAHRIGDGKPGPIAAKIHLAYKRLIEKCLKEQQQYLCQ